MDEHRWSIVAWTSTWKDTAWLYSLPAEACGLLLTVLGFAGYGRYHRSSSKLLLVWFVSFSGSIPLAERGIESNLLIRR